MGELVCKHPDEPHTMWWWDTIDTSAMPVPRSARYDNRADAVEAATELRDRIEGGDLSPARYKWIKVFRSDNESYTCWRWPEFVRIP